MCLKVCCLGEFQVFEFRACEGYSWQTMVRQKCFVCKVEGDKAALQKISFHRLPADKLLRKVWISLLELTETEQRFPKVMLICSRHFQPSDFVTQTSGRSYLKPHAVPKPVHPMIPSPIALSPPGSISPDQFSPVREGSNEEIIESSPPKIYTNEMFLRDTDTFIQPTQSELLTDVRESPDLTSSKTVTASSATDMEYEPDVLTESNQSRRKSKRCSQDHAKETNGSYESPESDLEEGKVASEAEVESGCESYSTNSSQSEEEAKHSGSLPGERSLNSERSEGNTDAHILPAESKLLEDFRFEDMQNLELASQFLKIAKKTITTQKYLIKSGMQTNRRLRIRLHLLREVIKRYLQDVSTENKSNRVSI